MYIYPDNLRAKATLWLWELRDVGICGAGFIVSAFALAKLGSAVPLSLTAAFAFLTVRAGGTSILDFLRNAARYLFAAQQYYEWQQYYERRTVNVRET